MDGLYWRGLLTRPRANAAWWEEKFRRNRERDRRSRRALMALGWAVVRLADLSVVRDPANSAKRALRSAKKSAARRGLPWQNVFVGAAEWTAAETQGNKERTAMKQTFTHVSTSSRGVGLYRLVDEAGKPVGDGTIYVSSKTVFGGFPATVEIEFEASPEFAAEQQAARDKAAAKAAEKEAKDKAKAARAEAKAKIEEARAALKAARDGAKPATAPAAAEAPAAQPSTSGV